MPSLQTQADVARGYLKAEYDRAKKRSNGNKNKFRPRPLPAERNTVVLWGMHHGWFDTQIAEYFYLSKGTVLNTRRRFGEDPQSIFKIPILRVDIVGNKHVYRCEACGRRMGVRGSRRGKHGPT